MQAFLYTNWKGYPKVMWSFSHVYNAFKIQKYIIKTLRFFCVALRNSLLAGNSGNADVVEESLDSWQAFWEKLLLGRLKVNSELKNKWNNKFSLFSLSLSHSEVSKS